MSFLEEKQNGNIQGSFRLCGGLLLGNQVLSERWISDPTASGRWCKKELKNFDVALGMWCRPWRKSMTECQKSKWTQLILNWIWNPNLWIELWKWMGKMEQTRSWSRQSFWLWQLSPCGTEYDHRGKGDCCLCSADHKRWDAEYFFQAERSDIKERIHNVSRISSLLLEISGKMRTKLIWERNQSFWQQMPFLLQTDGNG